MVKTVPLQPCWQHSVDTVGFFFQQAGEKTYLSEILYMSIITSRMLTCMFFANQSLAAHSDNKTYGVLSSTQPL